MTVVDEVRVDSEAIGCARDNKCCAKRLQNHKLPPQSECMPIVTNVPKFTVVTQFDLIQSS